MFIILTLNESSYSTESINVDNEVLWLEDLQNKKTIDWVSEQNNRTLAKYGSSPEFNARKNRILEDYVNNKSFDLLFYLGDQLGRLKKSGYKSKGILQTITLNEFSKDNPNWKTLINLNELSQRESSQLTYSYSKCNYDLPKQCLVGLSINGADAVELREFNLTTGKLERDGFLIPSGKTESAWVDKNSLLYSSTFRGEPQSKSGFGLSLKLLKKGSDVKSAKELLRVREGIGIAPRQFYSDGEVEVLVEHWIDFYNSNLYHYKNGSLIKFNIPTSFELYGVHKGFAVVKLYQQWEYAGRNFSVGSLVGIDLDTIANKAPKMELIYKPSKRQSLKSIEFTKSHILLNVLEDMITKPVTVEGIVKEGKTVWIKEGITKPTNDVLRFISTSPLLDEAIVTYRGFLNPNSLYFLSAKEKSHRFWRSANKTVDTSNFAFSYHYTASADGTEIPYQMVGPSNIDPSKTYPAIIYVYGAYGLTRTAFYSSHILREWVAKGGVYVIANPRGGGAYGEPWHQAAVRTSKHKTTDDVAAVARDLIKRNISNSSQIGVVGGSLGGLTACSVLTSYPRLFNAAICKAPITDMLRYTKLFNGDSWKAELGDPDDREERLYLNNHSPFHAIKKGGMIPSPLLISYQNDDRIHPSHASRMVARMHEAGMESYLFQVPNSGHTGPATKEGKAHLRALEYEYFINRLFN